MAGLFDPWTVGHQLIGDFQRPEKRGARKIYGFRGSKFHEIVCFPNSPPFSPVPPLSSFYPFFSLEEEEEREREFRKSTKNWNLEPFWNLGGEA